MFYRFLLKNGATTKSSTPLSKPTDTLKQSTDLCPEGRSKNYSKDNPNSLRALRSVPLANSLLP
nr:MAG TPA: hypothetical protein [Caudoviricetes sp.]